jgi:hypothetical protein
LVKEGILSIINRIFRFVFPGKVQQEETGGHYSPVREGATLPGSKLPDQDLLSKEHELQHRALVYLMTQKTDSVLAALSKTIENERRKLGVEKLQPLGDVPIHQQYVQTEFDDNTQGHDVDQILSMANNGETISKIARQLVLPENEISMVLRLNGMG